MFYYEGLSCPVCNKPFNDNDDVVACPKCGLPHHRSCWAIDNQCHEADKHDTPEQWSREKAVAEATKNYAPPEGSPENSHVCPYCFTKNAQYAEFCKHCGKELEAEDWHSAESTPPPVREYTPRYAPFSATESYTDHEKIDGVSVKDLAAVVGNNAPYYVSRFRRVNQNKFCGWNWAAFLLGPLWLLYRKQYVTGGILFVVDTVCTLIYNLFSYSIYPATGNASQINTAQMMASPWFTAAMIASTLLLALRVLLGVFGNTLYLNFCKNKIRKIKQDIPDISSTELSSKGGVSFGVAIVFYFLSSLLSNVMLTLFL